MSMSSSKPVSNLANAANLGHGANPVPDTAYPGVERLLAVVAQLRNPHGGCPWDLKQTHHSLKRYLLEEAYEVLEAIDEGDALHLKEELGDLLLQVALHAQIARDNEQFDFDAVAEAIAEKLIRRHPHVFGDKTVDSAEAVTQNWQQIKAAEKAEKGEAPPTSILQGIGTHLPALMRGTELSKRAVAVGFKWPSDESLWQCVMSEFDEFKQEATATQPSADRLEDEMGDILFATISLANHYKVDPETALARGNAKFMARFTRMEQLAAGEPLETLSFEAWDALWKQAKRG